MTEIRPKIDGFEWSEKAENICEQVSLFDRYSFTTDEALEAIYKVRDVLTELEEEIKREEENATDKE